MRQDDPGCASFSASFCTSYPAIRPLCQVMCNYCPATTTRKGKNKNSLVCKIIEKQIIWKDLNCFPPKKYFLNALLSTSGSECVNISPTELCEIKKNEGTCDDIRIQKYCAKTCDACTSKTKLVFYFS